MEHLVPGLASLSGKQGNFYHSSKYQYLNIKTEKHVMSQKTSDNLESEPDIVSCLFICFPCYSLLSSCCKTNWVKVFSNSRTGNFGKYHPPHQQLARNVTLELARYISDFLSPTENSSGLNPFSWTFCEFSWQLLTRQCNGRWLDSLW